MKSIRPVLLALAPLAVPLAGAAQTDSAAPPTAPALQPADTTPPAGVIERAFTFTSGALTLAGTLTAPDGVDRPPVAVIVAGSGPTDRNGNQGTRLRTNTYAQLAWGLARQGIASLRYDKRVLPATKGEIVLPELSFDDFVADVGAAVEAVRADSLGPVVVVGHSEGGSLAIRATARGLAVDGLVLVATPGRGVTDLLHEQLGRQLDAATLAQFDSAFARYLRGEDPGELPAPLRPLVLPVNRRFMQTWATLDPRQELASVGVPTLILQGETDIQVRVADAQALAAARPEARLVILPATNHTLKAATDTVMSGQLRTYTDPTVPIAPAVVHAIGAFVKSLSEE